MNGPQNGCSVGKSSADWLMATATTASTSPARLACQRRCSAGSSGEPCGGPRHRRRVAAEEQEDDRGLAGPERGRQGLALGLERPGPGGPRPGVARPRITGRARSRDAAACSTRDLGLDAIRDGLASRDTGRLGGLGLDPGGVRLEGEALQ